ncbi:AI-2E family transporter [Achromobacter mucicolens]|uniref:AI-2E family transporter n=1 Tax=Achromobacter mucicolens TaxID=1389922 RepID=UPI0009D5EC0B|nr:AI-2E family transporter [Achromobacter mucicolens]MDG9970730.1 AI-2E family transporter [Achromobacter mucicolens]WBX91216.1 AI-2E family transporter [Achromobacter mucicolens]
MMDSATPVDTSTPRQGPEPVTAPPAEEKPEPPEEKVTAQDAGLIKPPAPTPLVRVSGFCLVTLTVLAVLFGLKAAQEFIVPVVMAIVVAYTLDPVVAMLERYRVPRSLGTVVVMGAIAFGIGCVIYFTQDQVTGIINALPEISSKLSRTLGGLLSGDGSFLEKLRNAASILQESGAPKAGGRVVVAKPDAGLSDILLWGSKGLATFVGQATMCVFLVFFLLLSGNAFKRKFVKMAGNTLSQKKISVHMLDQINNSIHMYMAMMLVTNLALGLLSWVAFRWLGLENAATWAVVAGALHIIPYFGPLMTAVGTGIAGLVQFGELGPALAISMSSVAIALLIGVLVTTWMSGRIARMNAVAVFIVLLLFTWLWGIWGTLLSVPIAFIAKVVADHIEGLEALSEFLSE